MPTIFIINCCCDHLIYTIIILYIINVIVGIANICYAIACAETAATRCEGRTADSQDNRGELQPGETRGAV